jgi:hypothetical protein
VTLPLGYPLSGSVRAPDGAPVVGADLDVTNEATGERVPTPGDATGGSGAYRVVIEPGTYTVFISPPEGSRLVPAAISGVVVGGATTLDVTLENGFIVTGSVQDGSGSPLGGSDLDIDDRATGDRVWNPTDAVNPYNPLSVERQERPGSDLGILRWNFSALTLLETVYVPKRSARWEESLFLGRLKANILKTDLEFMGGKTGRENMVGMGHAAQVFDGSFRSEAAYSFNSEARRDFARAVVSFDRSFSLPNTLYLLGEYFYNGIGERSRYDYARVVLNARDQPFLGGEYFGLGATYDLTALWKAECYGILNLSDGSAFLGPKISWSAAENFELAAGYQVFNGRDRTEYGNLRDVGFIQAQWFFSAR